MTDEEIEKQKDEDWEKLKEILDDPSWSKLKFFDEFIARYGGGALVKAIDHYMLLKKKFVWGKGGYIHKDKIKKTYEPKKETENIWDLANKCGWEVKAMDEKKS